VKSVVKTFEVGADKRARPQTSEAQPNFSLFYRSRIEYIAEVTSVFGPFSPKNESKDSIKELLEKALEKHKEDVSEDDTDATRLAAIRDSDERTNKKLAEMEKKIDALLKASNAGN